jgi:hypothetical protein
MKDKATFTILPVITPKRLQSILTIFNHPEASVVMQLMILRVVGYVEAIPSMVYTANERPCVRST